MHILQKCCLRMAFVLLLLDCSAFTIVTAAHGQSYTYANDLMDRRLPITNKNRNILDMNSARQLLPTEDYRKQARDISERNVASHRVEELRKDLWWDWSAKQTSHNMARLQNEQANRNICNIERASVCTSVQDRLETHEQAVTQVDSRHQKNENSRREQWQEHENSKLFKNNEMRQQSENDNREYLPQQIRGYEQRQQQKTLMSVYEILRYMKNNEAPASWHQLEESNDQQRQQQEIAMHSNMKQQHDDQRKVYKFSRRLEYEETKQNLKRIKTDRDDFKQRYEWLMEKQFHNHENRRQENSRPYEHKISKCLQSENIRKEIEPTAGRDWINDQKIRQREHFQRKEYKISRHAEDSIIQEGSRRKAYEIAQQKEDKPSVFKNYRYQKSEISGYTEDSRLKNPKDSLRQQSEHIENQQNKKEHEITSWKNCPNTRCEEHENLRKPLKENFSCKGEDFHSKRIIKKPAEICILKEQQQNKHSIDNTEIREQQEISRDVVEQSQAKRFINHVQDDLPKQKCEISVYTDERRKEVENPKNVINCQVHKESREIEPANFGGEKPDNIIRNNDYRLDKHDNAHRQEREITRYIDQNRQEERRQELEHSRRVMNHQAPINSILSTDPRFDERDDLRRQELEILRYNDENRQNERHQEVKSDRRKVNRNIHQESREMERTELRGKQPENIIRTIDSRLYRFDHIRREESEISRYTDDDRRNRDDIGLQEHEISKYTDKNQQDDRRAEVKNSREEINRQVHRESLEMELTEFNSEQPDNIIRTTDSRLYRRDDAHREESKISRYTDEKRQDERRQDIGNSRRVINRQAHNELREMERTDFRWEQTENKIRTTDSRLIKRNDIRHQESEISRYTYDNRRIRDDTRLYEGEISRYTDENRKELHRRDIENSRRVINRQAFRESREMERRDYRSEQPITSILSIDRRIDERDDLSREDFEISRYTTDDRQDDRRQAVRSSWREVSSQVHQESREMEPREFGDEQQENITRTIDSRLVKRDDSRRQQSEISRYTDDNRRNRDDTRLQKFEISKYAEENWQDNRRQEVKSSRWEISHQGHRESQEMERTDFRREEPLNSILNIEPQFGERDDHRRQELQIPRYSDENRQDHHRQELKGSRREINHQVHQESPQMERTEFRGKQPENIIRTTDSRLVKHDDIRRQESEISIYTVDNRRNRDDIRLQEHEISKYTDENRRDDRRAEIKISRREVNSQVHQESREMERRQFGDEQQENITRIIDSRLVKRDDSRRQQSDTRLQEFEISKYTEENWQNNRRQELRSSRGEINRQGQRESLEMERTDFRREEPLNSILNIEPQFGERDDHRRQELQIPRYSDENRQDHHRQELKSSIREINHQVHQESPQMERTEFRGKQPENIIRTSNSRLVKHDDIRRQESEISRYTVDNRRNRYDIRLQEHEISKYTDENRRDDCRAEVKISRREVNRQVHQESREMERKEFRGEQPENIIRTIDSRLYKLDNSRREESDISRYTDENRRERDDTRFQEFEISKYTEENWQDNRRQELKRSRWEISHQGHRESQKMERTDFRREEPINSDLRFVKRDDLRRQELDISKYTNENRKGERRQDIENSKGIISRQGQKELREMERTDFRLKQPENSVLSTVSRFDETDDFRRQKRVISKYIDDIWQSECSQKHDISSKVLNRRDRRVSRELERENFRRQQSIFTSHSADIRLHKRQIPAFLLYSDVTNDAYHQLHENSRHTNRQKGEDCASVTMQISKNKNSQCNNAQHTDLRSYGGKYREESQTQFGERRGKDLHGEKAYQIHANMSFSIRRDLIIAAQIILLTFVFTKVAGVDNKKSFRQTFDTSMRGLLGL